MKREREDKKMSVFEQIAAGLKEGIAQARGELTLKTTTVPAPAPRLTKSRVIAIRKNAGMSQGVLAAYLNVPKRTLESWEQGRRAPKAGEARLLQIMEAAPKEFEALLSAIDKDGPKRQVRKRVA